MAVAFLVALASAPTLVAIVAGTSSLAPPFAQRSPFVGDVSDLPVTVSPEASPGSVAAPAADPSASAPPAGAADGGAGTAAAPPMGQPGAPIVAGVPESARKAECPDRGGAAGPAPAPARPATPGPVEPTAAPTGKPSTARPPARPAPAGSQSKPPRPPAEKDDGLLGDVIGIIGGLM
jgi:hypothetical protein